MIINNYNYGGEKKKKRLYMYQNRITSCKQLLKIKEFILCESEQYRECGNGAFVKKC